MTQDKLRAASIGLFMKALIVELLEKNKRQNESADIIARRVGKYVRKHFKTKADQDLLAKIANGAWDMACDISEFRELSVATLCMELYDSVYREIIEKELKLKGKLFQNFYNATRSESGLKVKIDSKAVTKDCLECINKCIYDFTKE